MKNWKTYIPFIAGLPLLYFLPRPETPGWVGNVLYVFFGLLLFIVVAILGWAISRKVKIGPIITTIQGLVPSGGRSMWPKALLILIFILMHLTVWWIWWTWWHDNLWSRWSLIAHAGFAFGFLALVRGPKAKPAQHLFGLILILLTSLLVLNETGIVRMGEKWPAGSGVFPPSWSAWASSNPPSGSTPGQNIYARGTATLTPPTERFDEECKARAATLNTEMREKIKVDFKDHPLIIPVACRESGFNQTKRGTTEVLKGEDPDDHGAFQINLTHHAAKIKELGLDVDTYEGNAAYTKYLLSLPHGIDNWFPKVKGRWYAPMTVTIPITKDWSPYIQIPELTKKIQYLIRNKKPFIAEMDGVEAVMDPELDKSYGAAKKIRFKSINGNDSVMDIPIEFHPVP